MEYRFSDKVLSLKPSAIREILKMTSQPGIISFAAGNPAPDAFPVESIRAIASDILSKDPIAALQYSVTEGFSPLREAVKARLTKKSVFTEGKDDVIITSGGQQASELTCKSFLNEGDVLAAEDPSFVGCLNAFRSYNADLRGIPMDSEGIRADLLEEQAKKGIKLLYVIPNFQNPSGRCMSFARRKAVYELACKYDFIILEDDPYGELRFAGEDIPSIKSLDTEGRVVYAGSFSKVISPGMRVGFVCAAPEIISKIVVCKQVSDVHSNILAQMICHRILTETDFDAHLESLRRIYLRKYSIMEKGIKDNFSDKVTVTHPQGGLFVWATLPEGSDMPAFCTEAVRRKVAVVPGNAFTSQPTDPTTSFRMNFSTPTDEQLVTGCEILGQLTREFCR
ncbi:MAG: PLP-dependent aminotransferase family protein [Oscillospiraceae bacterium]|nr:PLP-dependent aminotransferase family protein [Oscillospiraceae bacterium]MBQ8979144.1 PLP-dependent aminotransferase family protein [Oscillospiraceae bacterium]